MIYDAGQWLYGYLFMAWLIAIGYNWYLIEKTIRGIGAEGPYIERIGLRFPYVVTHHPRCPPELSRVYRSCMRWIYGPTALLGVLAIFLG